MKKIIFFMLTFFYCSYQAYPDPLIFVTDANFPPYNYHENGKLKGIDIDIVREMAKRLDIKIKIKLFPWKRLLACTKSGKADCAFSLFLTKERTEYALFSKIEVHNSSYFIFVKKGKEFQFHKIQDLYGKKIGLNTGFAISNEFDEAVNKGKIKTQPLHHIEAHLKKLLHGRIDGYVGQLHVTLYHLKKMGIYKRISYLLKPVKGKRKAFFVVSKNSKRIKNKKLFIRKVNRVLKEMKKEGFYKKIEEKYIQ